MRLAISPYEQGFFIYLCQMLLSVLVASHPCEAYAYRVYTVQYRGLFPVGLGHSSLLTRYQRGLSSAQQLGPSFSSVMFLPAVYIYIV